MVNEEQLSILKQGVDAWNQWRLENPGKVINLSTIDLSEHNLIGFNLNKADMSNTDFYGADLEKADLSEADLSKCNLDEADLIEANLNKANLERAYIFASDLREADLREANLNEAYLYEANLSGANLSKATLEGTNLQGANLRKANLTEAWVGGTVFGRNDLSETVGLEKVEYEFPYVISTDTIRLSKGKIPIEFLRGCGLSDWEIESAKLYNPDLSNEEINKTLYKMYDLRATQALQVSPLFISYSHIDNAFVDKLEGQLNAKGIRFWRDTHEMKAGRIEKQIDRSMHLNPTVLLILSQHSIKSDWVEHEVRTARELEKEMGRDVLCPVALDNSWKDSRWPKRVMEQVMEYNILDFSAWKDDVKFESIFSRLIDGLELFYKR